MIARLIVAASLFTASIASAQLCSASFCRPEDDNYCCTDYCCSQTSNPACFASTPAGPITGLCCPADTVFPCENYTETNPTTSYWACRLAVQHPVCTSYCGVHAWWDSDMVDLEAGCVKAPPCPCNEFGDPVNAFNGGSSVRVRDVKVNGALGGLAFNRIYDSTFAAWSDDSPLHNIPKPFGGSASESDLPEWTHDALGVVTQSGEGTLWSVRKPGGLLRRYRACAGTPCWASPAKGNPSVPDRLQRTSTGFVLWERSGDRLVFDAPYVQPGVYGTLIDGGALGSAADTRYFISSIVNSSGVTARTFSYQLPTGLSCFQAGADAGTGAGVPYLYELASPESALRFDYVSLTPDAGGPSQCVIRNVYAVNLVDAGILATLATYGYASDGVAERPGRIASATLPDRTETYSYGSSFSTAIGGTPLSTHAYTDGKVSTDTSYRESLSLEWSLALCPSGAQCCGEYPTSATTTDSAAQIGSVDGGAATLVTTYLSLSNTGQEYEPRLLETNHSCSVAGACSPGTSRTEWVCSTANAPGYEQAVKNKRDNWEAYTWAAVDAGFLFPVLEKRGLARGATDKNGSSALETESYAYVYGSAGQQLPSTTTRASVVSSGDNTVEKRWYDSNNRLTKVTRAGYTKGFYYQNTYAQALGTLYFTSRSCGGSAGPDALGRTLEMHGPCAMTNDTDSDCYSSMTQSYPVTVYEYWAATETTLGRANRLKAVRRYVNGNADCASGTPLSTLYDDYDALGNARQVTDEAGNVTSYTFDGAGQMLSRSKGGNTTSFAYDNGKLFRMTYPAGNVELFCYRTGTNATCTNGTWTPQLQWKAKADSSGNWSELVKYTYAPDGTVAQEEYRGCYSGTCSTLTAGEVRRVSQFSADAHRRPTWRRTGEGAGQFVATSFFDRADNLAGVGLPFNSPPAWCGGPGTGGAVDEPTSKLCAALKYDRAERLASFTEFPQGSGGGGQSTCFGYDAHGNVSRVTPGCTASCNSDGTCGSLGLEHTTEYAWDDFGNIYKVEAPWTQGGGSQGKGRQTFQYDAFGNALYEQHAEQHEAASFEYRVNTYDFLGRPKSASVIQGSSAQLYTFFYDSTSTPSTCPTIANTGGRLSRRQDAYGDTYYSYDAEC